MFSAYARGTAAFVFCTFAATSAQAELSAQEVWSDWQAYFEASGYDVTGTETMSGDTLTVAGATLSLDLAEEDVAITIGLGDVTFRESGDGTVAIGFPTRMPITIDGSGEAGESFEAVVGYTHSDLSMVASGTREDLTYSYTAASVTMAIDEITVEGDTLPAETYRAAVTMTNILASTRVEGADLRTYTQTAQIGPVSYDVFFEDPDGNGELSVTGRTEGLEISGDSTLPGEMDPNDIAGMILAGFGGAGGFSFGPGASTLSFEDAGETFGYESSSSGGAFEVSVGERGIGYSVETQDLSVNVTGSEMPLPVSLTLGELGLGFLVPVMAGEDPQDFTLDIKLEEFALSDLIWGIFDPTGQLPRDPATILLALSGQATLLANILDPVVAAQLEEGPPPGELNAVTLEALEVSVAGASLTGEGAFTFDNSDLETFGGFPRPEGSVDLGLSGGNGLLDTLVAMGLVPEGEAMGARMMMGLFAVPGEGEDVLNSVIEINEQGHILANGQRIQ